MAFHGITDEQALGVAAALRERGVLRARDLLDLGLREVHIRTLMRRGALARIGRGVYGSRRVEATPERLIAAAAVRVPAGVVCGPTAARLHGLSDEVPAEVWMAVSRRTWRPVVRDLPVRFVTVSERDYDVGVETRVIEGVTVRMTGPERTVADLVKLRHRAGDEILEAGVASVPGNALRSGVGE